MKNANIYTYKLCNRLKDNKIINKMPTLIHNMSFSNLYTNPYLKSN